MLRRELNEILETNPKAEGKMTWNECLDYAAKIMQKSENGSQCHKIHFNNSWLWYIYVI